MNYLAHAWLSFRRPEVLVGNMISDFVKGKKQYDYPPGIQEGIQLHRAIDQFTDVHPATREAAAFFKPAVGLYAGAFVDIVYDHFLALDEREHGEEELQLFSGEVYAQLASSREWLPERFAAMLPSMQKHNWLYNYRFPYGIENSFYGLIRRASYLEDADNPFSLFTQHYAELENCYRNFFPDVKNMAQRFLTERTT